MTIIFDACALIAFLRDEAGADIVEAALIHESCGFMQLICVKPPGG